MAQDPPPFRYRTILEVAIISLVIYYLLGTPGLATPSSASSPSSSSTFAEQDVPRAQSKSDSLVMPDSTLQCPPHAFEGVHLFSAKPLVIYIDGFLSEEEADHLVEISTDKWEPSTVFHGNTETTDPSVRKSEKALIDRDNTVQCVEARALAFQGWPENTSIERLRTQRYNVSGHYAHHYDWAAGSKKARRSSTFMVYLSSGDECEGGGTNFPRLGHPGGKWCELVECGGGEDVDGVTFKVRKGAAIFWMNFDDDGRGYKETIHAGMPVRKGTKVGLNVWSWYQA